MRIVIACEWFLKLVVDGQARALRERGHEVLVLTRSDASEFGGDANEKGALLDGLEGIGVHVAMVDGRRFDASGLANAVGARGRVRDFAPDVAIVHENADPRLLVALAGVPTIYVFHDPEPHPGGAAPRKPERAVRSLWLRRADRIVVHGPELIPSVASRLQQKTVALAHGIDVSNTPLPVPPVPTVLLFGKLEPWKGVPVLLEAMRLVWRDNPDVRLLIAGDGPAADQIPSSDSRIEFRRGYVPEVALERLFNEATVGVLPYLQIAQSGVGSSLVARGVPIVVTRTGALSDLVHDSRYVAEVSDAKSLATALGFALSRPDGERATVLAHAQSHLSWRRVAEGYEKLAEQVALSRKTANKTATS